MHLTGKDKPDDAPDYQLEFPSLWSLSEMEQANADQIRAQTALTRAQTAQIYCDMQALDPSEVRAGLAEDGEYNIETLLDDIPEDQLFESMPEQTEEPEEQEESSKEEKTVEIMQESPLEKSDGCDIIKDGKGKVGAPYGNDNASKDHQKEVKGPHGTKIKLGHEPSEYSNVRFGASEGSEHNIGGFEESGKANAHVKKHAKAMGMSEKEYKKKAYEFLSKPMTDSMEEIDIVDPAGHRRTYRYDYSTNEFGVINSRDNVSTYYFLKGKSSDWEGIIKESGRTK